MLNNCSPPSTVIFCPVIQFESSEIKKETTFAISEGSVNRLKGFRFIAFSINGFCFSINSTDFEKTIPELIKFTLISYGANSIAKYLHADYNADFAIPTAT